MDVPGGSTRPDAYDFYAAPVQRAPAPEAATTATHEGESGTRVRTAVAVTVVGLLMSFCLSAFAGTLADQSGVLDQQLRRALAITLFFYLLVGGALAWFCSRQRVRLVWSRGHLVDALLLGLPLGLVGGVLAVGINSAIAGHLSSDPGIELLVGGGGALRVALALAVTAVLAPLVEEVLFRGVLAGSLLAIGARTAMWVSAIAFAVWHMNLVSLRYYVLVGLLLFWLWRKGGLVCSIATHAAFNGVLTVAAVVATSGSAQLTQFGDVSFSLPGGWHVVDAARGASQLAVRGPAGAELQLSRTVVGPGLTNDALVAALAGRDARQVRITPGSTELVEVLGAQAVVADLVAQGEPGHILQVLDEGVLYQVVMVTAGSPAAEEDWRLVVRTTRVS